MFPEPGSEQPVAVGFAPIAVVTQIKQDVQVLHKELVDDGENGLLYFGVIPRTHSLHLLNDKLEGATSADRHFFFKRYGIVDSSLRLKDVATFWREHYIVMRMLIDSIERELYHSATMVPVSPLRAHSSAMRFSAARFTSKECLKRANASSYVIFFISIIVHSWVSAAKVGINHELTKEIEQFHGQHRTFSQRGVKMFGTELSDVFFIDQELEN